MKKYKKIIGFCLALITVSCADKEECTYDDTFPYACDNGMDVAFVIDYTGSMGSAINNIKTGVASIASTIVTESGGDYRLSLSIFDEYEKTLNPTYFSNVDYTSLPAANKKIITTGTSVNQYLTMMEKFSALNSGTFSTQLAKLNGAIPLGNGNSFAEPGGLLMNEIVNNAFASPWRTGKTKIMIIITDATDGGDDDIATAVDDAYLSALATQANAAQIQCILISTYPSSNYQVHFIGNNTTGVTSINSDNFASIASSINTLIENLCDSNIDVD